MADNFYYNCPAKMYGRGFTDYRLNSDTNQIIMKNNGIQTPEEYRQFLQTKGIDAVPKYNYKCWNTETVHDYPTRQNPLTFYEETEKTNQNEQIQFKKFYK